MSDRYAGYERLELDYPAPRILQVTLNTPGRLNAADAVMHAELGRIWRDVDGDPDVSCVMIRGAGKAFSAGGDLDMIEEMTQDFFCSHSPICLPYCNFQPMHLACGGTEK